MNKFLIQKFTALLLLLILVFSCAGLGLGMMSYGKKASEHISHSVATQECCEMENSFGGSFASADNFFAHHEINQFILSQKVFFALFVAVFFVVYFLFVFNISRIYFRQYLRSWQDRWKYFAFLFTRLFSNGLLHSKAW